MQHIAQNWRRGDALWVYYGAGQAFEYYRRSHREFLPLRGNVRVGACRRSDPRDYLRQVDELRGRPRAWILLVHDYGIERRLIVKYLDTIGERLGSFQAPEDDRSPFRALVLLYDLSRKRGMRKLTAERFPVDRERRGQNWSCYGTMSPLGAAPDVVKELETWPARKAKLEAGRSD